MKIKLDENIPATLVQAAGSFLQGLTYGLKIIQRH